MAEIYKQSFKQDYSDHVEMAIFNCGLEHCAPLHSWGPAVRDHYLIHLVVDGHGCYRAGGQEHHLGPGDLFLLRPGQLAGYSASEDDPWEYYWVGFNGAYASKLVQHTPFTEQKLVFHSTRPEPLQQALLSIFNARGPKPENEAAMVGNLYLFLSELMHQAAEKEIHAPSAGSQYVLNAIKYLQFNYSHEITIDDIARTVGVSRRQLYRLFMSNVGQRPFDYLTSYRIGEACNLLKNSQLSIAEIATSVGFSDKFYFSRVFKKSMGMPPSRYLSAMPDHSA